MGTYRKKPVEVNAEWWPGGASTATPIINWILVNGGTARYHEEVSAYTDDIGAGLVRNVPAEPEHIAINTLEGTMRALPGDYIIRGVQGEFYPCKPDIFDATYEEV